MKTVKEFRENSESICRVGVSQDPGELSVYFNLRGKPGAKGRDLDPRVFFVLAYEGDEVVGGIRCLIDEAGTDPLHIEQRSGVNVAARIEDHTSIDVRGQTVGEIASVVLAPQIRGSSAVRALYAEAAHALAQRGADFIVAAPYYPNDQLVLRFLRARGDTALSLGNIEVADDNVAQGRQKNLLVMPVTAEMKMALKPPAAA
ncbi:MAG: GNAT family N-acetyltransferase [Alphaproteobacteria bacterium]|nr:GNAT family N-acetyltransferase [Alphaproteobacteria bacterium]MBU0859254.1 GNAT family N-acetyltransferase [Alphaproteobacteria bacterium]